MSEILSGKIPGKQTVRAIYTIHLNYALISSRWPSPLHLRVRVRVRVRV